MLESDVNLWVIADSSTNDTEKQEQLHEKGMNIIILDHHNVDKEIPECVYLVNNQFENSESENLSGVGVVGQFIRACGYSIDKYSDLIAVGLVADSMDMTNVQNKAYVNEGLSNLNNDLIKEFFKERVYDTIIPRLVRLAEAPSHGKPILEYEPRNKGTIAYLNLAKEVIERNGTKEESSR